MVLYVEGLMLLCRLLGNPRCSEPSVFVLPFVLPVLFAVLQLWAWQRAYRYRQAVAKPGYYGA